MDAVSFFLQGFPEFLSSLGIVMLISSAIAFFLVLVMIYYARFVRKVVLGRYEPLGSAGPTPVFVLKGTPKARCPGCGTLVIRGWRYCPSCGREIGSLWPRKAREGPG